MKKIAIVGAGPAGLILGNYLIKNNHDVTIFEKNNEIISTPCGEGISKKATDILEKDTSFDSKKFFSSKVKGLKNFFPGGKISFLPAEGGVLDRQDWLIGMQKHFEKSNGKIVFNKQVNTPGELHDFDYIVGAEGPNSALRRHINGKIDIVPASQYKMELDWENKEWLEFYWDKESSKFYSWIFPKRDYYNVGVIGTFVDLDKFIKKYGIRGKIIKKEAHPIPFSGVKIHENNIALIGDAAGMANPFSKGGLAVNIYASKILIDCIENDNLLEYEKRIKNHVAFSKLYSKVCSTISEMSQEDLGIIGEIVDGQEDLLNLKISAYLKALKHPKILPRMLTIYSGFKEGIEYGW